MPKPPMDFLCRYVRTVTGIACHGPDTDHQLSLVGDVGKATRTSRRSVLGTVLLGLVGLLAATGWTAGQEAGERPGAAQVQPGDGQAATDDVAEKGQPLLDAQGDPLPAGAVRRFGTLRFRHGKGTGPLVWTPDGKRLVTAGNEEIWIWDATTGKILKRLPGQFVQEDALHQKIHYHPNSLDISADGSRLMASYNGAGFRVWDFASGKKLCECPGIAGTLSRDGKTLFTGGKRNDVSLQNVDIRYILGHDPIRRWDTATGKELPPVGRGVPVAVSADGKLLAAITGDYTCPPKRERKVKNQVISLWDTASGREVHHLALTEGLFDTGIFTSEGLCYFLASNIIEENFGVWLWPPGGQPRRWPFPPSRNSSLFFSPDGKQVAYSATPFIHVRDLASGKEVRRLPMFPWEWGAPLAFSPDSGRLAIHGESALMVWDLATGKEVCSAEGHKGGIAGAALTQDGRLLCTAGEDGVIHFWDTHTGKIIRSWQDRGHGSFGRVVLSPDDKHAAAPGGNQVFVWNAATGKRLHELTLPTIHDGTLCPTFSPDGKYLAGGGWKDGELVLWDTATGKQVWMVKPERERRMPFIADIAFSPDGKVMAVTGGRKAILLREAATGKLLGRLPSPSGDQTNPHVLAFSADGRTLVFSHFGVIRLWEMATRDQRLEIKTKEWHNATALSPDRRLLVTGGELVHLWDARTGKEVRRFIGHRGRINHVAFSADGRYVLSCSSDTTAVLWRVPSLLRKKAADASREKLLQWWQTLARRNAAQAYQAQGQLTQTDNAVAFLREQLPPAKQPDPAKVARWIKDLGDDRFKVRHKAQQELENLDELVRPALHAALTSPPTLEAHERIKLLLDRLDALTEKQLQAMRTLEVLEWTGTPEARGVVARLAQGVPGAWLTTEAQTTLRRMVRK